jgi:hypothetical protein
MFYSNFYRVKDYDSYMDRVVSPAYLWCKCSILISIVSKIMITIEIRIENWLQTRETTLSMSEIIIFDTIEIRIEHVLF